MKKKYKKYKNSIEAFLSSEKGKRLFTFFYSWGASIVILGALFKLLHLPYGNQMLFIGMMTEFFVFFISAFEKPGKDYNWEEVFPVLSSKDISERPLFGGGGGGKLSPEELEAMKAQGGSGGFGGGFIGGGAGGGFIGGGGGDFSPQDLEALKAQAASMTPEEIEALKAIKSGGGSTGGVIMGGGAGNLSAEALETLKTRAASMSIEEIEALKTIQEGGFVGGGVVSGGSPSFNLPPELNVSEEDAKNLTESIKKLSTAAEQLSKMGELTDATQQCMSQLTDMANNMQRFGEVTNSLTDASNVLLGSYQLVVENSENIHSNSSGYIHQMESLNRNISGLNTIYEIQLKSISSQIDTIERINGGLGRIRELYDGSITDSSVFKSETEKMAQQLSALNNIYARLLSAMTAGANPMYGYHPGGAANQQNPNE